MWMPGLLRLKTSQITTTARTMSLMKHLSRAFWIFLVDDPNVAYKKAGVVYQLKKLASPKAPRVEGGGHSVSFKCLHLLVLSPFEIPFDGRPKTCFFPRMKDSLRGFQGESHQQDPRHHLDVLGMSPLSMNSWYFRLSFEGEIPQTQDTTHCTS